MSMTRLLKSTQFHLGTILFQPSYTHSQVVALIDERQCVENIYLYNETHIPECWDSL